MRKCCVEKFGDTFRFLYFTGKKKSKIVESLEDNFDESNTECVGDNANIDDDEREQLRLRNNICRARSRVRELALCNEWAYFVTLTINAEKQDRYSIKDYIRAFGDWINNFRKKWACGFSYLVIPEQHKDRAWHMHGLFSELPAGALRRNEYGYLTVPDYERRFGFVSLDPIRSTRRVASYITKYITKDFATDARRSGEHLFYASQGLKGREPLFEFEVPSACAADFENEWVGISWRDRDTLEGKLLRDYYTFMNTGHLVEAANLMCRVQELIYNRTDNFDTMSSDKMLLLASLNSQSSSS